MALNLKDAQPGDVRHKIVPFNITGAVVKAEDDKTGFESDTSNPNNRFAGFLRGFAGRLMNIDKGLDCIFPGAFGDLGEFLKEGAVNWQHDWSEPIGLPLVAREVHAPDWGLYTESRISRTPTGEKAMTLINDKVVKKLSIGYRLKPKGYSIVNREGLVALMRGYHLPIPEDKQEEVLADFDRRKLEEVWALTNLDLFEYSPVTFPMNAQAEILGSKAISDNLGGALDGLPFAFHPLIVATAVRGLVGRLKTFKAIRETDRRKLSKAHVDGLTEVIAALEETLGEAKTLQTEINAQGSETGDTGAGETPQLTPPAEAVALYSKFLELEARALGGLSET